MGSWTVPLHVLYTEDFENKSTLVKRASPEYHFQIVKHLVYPIWVWRNLGLSNGSFGNGFGLISTLTGILLGWSSIGVVRL